MLSQPGARTVCPCCIQVGSRSEEHTSELQSRFGISYAVFCLKKKKVRRLLTATRRVGPGENPAADLRLAVRRGQSLFFNDTATTEIYPLSLHDPLPISRNPENDCLLNFRFEPWPTSTRIFGFLMSRSEEHTSELQSRFGISYAVFC